MEARVIDNGLDFIGRASEDLTNLDLPEYQQLKYSTVELYEGIELLMKARLMQEHWSLVLRDVDHYKREAFEKGDFLSVNYETARERLANLCDVEIERQADQAFDALRRLRNRYVHFSCDESRPSVLGVQLRAWHHILRLLENRFLGDLSAQQTAVVERVRAAMLASKEFLDKRYEELRDQVEQARSRKLFVLSCPTCGKDALLIGDVSEECPKCLVCAVTEMNPEDTAEAYSAAKDPWWRHPRHGPDDDLAWCDQCDRQTVAEVGPEVRDQIHAVFEHVERQPGEDWVLYLCFACGNPNISIWLHHCSSCGAQYFGSEDGSCPACHWF